MLVLAGPTGVGKSRLAMRVAAVLGRAEIVSADSVQVYRGLNIGSSKPSRDDCAAVRHHCLDVAGVDDDFTTATFVDLAVAAVDDVRSRGAVPLVVGGAGMYLDWLVNGRPTTAAAPRGVKERVRAMLAEDHSWTKSLARLEKVDPRYAGQLLKNDYYRLGRALEIVETTGMPVPVGRLLPLAADGRHVMDGVVPVALTRNRLELCRQIDARCEDMVADGLVQEVLGLLAAHPQLPSTQAGQAIGYRQTISFIDRLVGDRYLVRSGEQMPARSAAARRRKLFRAYVSEFQAATRAYARRQVNWFARDASFRWINLDRLAGECGADADATDERVFTEAAERLADGWRGDASHHPHENRTDAKVMRTYRPVLGRFADDATVDEIMDAISRSRPR